MHPAYVHQFAGQRVAPVGNVSSPTVAEAQTLLNAMGYGPLKVDGIFGSNTSAEVTRALQQSVGSVDANVLEQLRKLAGSGHRAPVKAPGPVSVTGATNTGLVQQPLWKQPLFIGLGVAALMGVAFFVLKNETSAFSGTSEGDAEPRRARGRGRGRKMANGDAVILGDDVFGDVGAHAKPIEGEVTKKKCRRTPDFDAAEGEEVVT